jgi:linoleate 9S-lipoxygenase
MAVEVEDESSPHKKQVRLLIEDYPYASDGLAIWNAIEQWVEKYLAIYYTNDDVVKSDEELQEWWKEVREVGHGDLKDEPWWPKMQTVAELTRTCSTIIWIASALHAAINFGQYPYCAWYPNRPSISRKPMPDKKELQVNPEECFLKCITRMPQALLGISLVELLSAQYSDEVYLGQRDNPEWTSDEDAKAAFEAFADSLKKIEEELDAKNRNDQLHNRKGPVKFPYTLLFPNTSGKKITGITARGIPNSVSI